MDKYENRRLRLLDVIARYCGGRRSDFAKRVGLSDSYVARMLYPEDREGRKRIGEDMCDRIEDAFNLPDAYLDLPIEKDAFESALTGKVREVHSGVEFKAGAVQSFHPEDPVPDGFVLVPQSRIEFSAGNGRVANYEFVEDAEPAIYRRDWLRKHGLKPDRLKRFPVHGDSQEPMLYHGDMVTVNLDETHIVDGKLYAIRYDNDLRIKFLFKKLDGSLILRSINPAYPDEEVPPHLANEYISVIGRVRDASGSGGL